jgi:dihydrofolate synthase / folylpolyglutamate synthase
MDKEAAVSYVMGLNPRKYELGLENIRAFLQKSGNPQDMFPSLIVGGTNGKGSTAHFLASILTESGYHTGRFTSPFLYDFNERIVINNTPISDSDFVRLIGEIKHQTEEWGIHLSFFEFITVIALAYFAEQNIDVAVLEVGLGGRFDATNVVENVLASGITNIELEHMEWLGDSLEKIANEKAGIIKKDSVLCTTEKKDVINSLFHDRCEEHDSLFLQEGVDFSVKRNGFDQNKQMFTFSFGEKKMTNLDIHLLGEYQVKNAGLAMSMVHAIENKFPVSEEAMRAGLEKTLFEGRFEIISRNPLRIIDACHNPAGMRAFRKAFQELFPQKKASVVFGISEDKNADEMIADIAPIIDHLLVTRAQWRGMAPEKIQRIAQKKGIEKITIIPQVNQAVTALFDKKPEIACVCGSIFVLSEAGKLFKRVSSEKIIP